MVRTFDVLYIHVPGCVFPVWIQQIRFVHTHVHQLPLLFITQILKYVCAETITSTCTIYKCIHIYIYVCIIYVHAFIHEKGIYIGIMSLHWTQAITGFVDEFTNRTFLTYSKKHKSWGKHQVILYFLLWMSDYLMLFYT